MTRKSPTAAKKANRLASHERGKKTAAERNEIQQAAAKENKALGDRELTPWKKAKAARAERRKGLRLLHKS